MFGNNSKIEIAVMQEKFKTHEQMVERVDRAIQTLSETNQNICKMLVVHEEKIGQGSKEKDNLKLRVEKVETKVEGLSNFKWQVAGAIGFAIFLVGIINAFVPRLMSVKSLTAPQSQGMMERAK